MEESYPRKIVVEDVEFASLAQPSQKLVRAIKRWSARMALFAEEKFPTAHSREIMMTAITQGDEFIDKVQLDNNLPDDFADLLIEQISLNLASVLPLVPPESASSLPSLANETFEAVRFKDMLLPSVPTFDGNISEFRSFWSLFNKAVHNVRNLPDEIKLSTLFSKLSGRALALAKQHGTEAIHYQEIYNRLVAEYSAKYRLARSIYLLQDKIPNVATRDADQVEAFLREARSWTAAIRDLPTEDTSSFLLFEILFSRLHPDLQSTFSRQEMEPEDRVPTDVELLNFLEKELQLLRVVPPRISVASQPTTSSTAYPHGAPRSQLHAHTGSQTLNPIPWGQFRCHYCQQDHFLYRCQEFGSIPIAQRRRFVDLKSLCRNCLSHRHRTDACPSERTCSRCQKRHHQLLHLDGNAAPPRSSSPMLSSHQPSYPLGQKSPPRSRPDSPNRSPRAGSHILAGEHSSPCSLRRHEHYHRGSPDRFSNSDEEAQSYFPDPTLRGSESDSSTSVRSGVSKGVYPPTNRHSLSGGSRGKPRGNSGTPY